MDDAILLRKALVRLLSQAASRLPIFADGSHPLGWEAATLSAFVKADELLLTLPHASPNIFFPRAGVAWYARHLQQHNPKLFHLRIVLTHNNFGDLGWRPYAWWLLDDAHRLHRHTCFTRSKRLKHVAVMSQPPLAAVPAVASGVDRHAAALACHGRHLGDAFIGIMATIERAADLSLTNRTLYVPLDLAIACIKTEAQTYGITTNAMRRIMSVLLGRRLNSVGELEVTTDWRQAVVFDNPTNIALLAAYGHMRVIGGAKMQAYWRDVEARLELAGTAIGSMQLEPFPSANHIETLIQPSPALAEVLAALGLPYSQGMALVEHGAFAHRYSPFE